MPQPVIPEIDIHNYYVTNMAEIETHTAAPPPKHHESESSESVHYTMPVKEECPEMYVPYNPCPPVMPVYDCGCGGGDMHAGFFPPPYSMPYPQVPYPMPYPMAYPQMPAMAAPTGFTQIPAMAAPAGFMPQQQPAWQEGQQVMPGYEWEEESSSSSPYPYGPVCRQGFLRNILPPCRNGERSRLLYTALLQKAPLICRSTCRRKPCRSTPRIRRTSRSHAGAKSNRTPACRNRTGWRRNRTACRNHLAACRNRHTACRNRTGCRPVRL